MGQGRILCQLSARVRYVIFFSDLPESDKTTRLLQHDEWSVLFSATDAFQPFLCLTVAARPLDSSSAR